LVNAGKQLIEIFEQKIKERIARVWGAVAAPAAGAAVMPEESEESLDMAAEEQAEYRKN
jgi:hypothetical protein